MMMTMRKTTVNGNERLSLSFLLLRTSTVANNYRLISLLDRVSISLDLFNQYWKLTVLSTVTAVRSGTVLLPSDKPLSPPYCGFFGGWGFGGAPQRYYSCQSLTLIMIECFSSLSFSLFASFPIGLSDLHRKKLNCQGRRNAVHFTLDCSSFFGIMAD